MRCEKLFTFRLLSLLLMGVVLFSGVAAADPQSQSYSSWKWNDSELQVRYTIATSELGRLLGAPGTPQDRLAERLFTHLQQTIRVSSEKDSCTLSEPVRKRASRAAYVIADLRFHCEGSAEQLKVRIAALFDAAPSHIHFARFKVASDRQLERLFTRQAPQRNISFAAFDEELEAGGAGSVGVTGGLETFRAYTVLGFQHILEGLDHIAFLLALLLLSTKLRDVLLIVTGFTLGHSLTLSLSVLEIVQPNIALVESIIGLTIALVAIENVAVLSPHRRLIIGFTVGGLLLAALPAALGWQLRGPPASAVFGLALFSLCYLLLSDSEAMARRIRPVVTIVFGLVHGFGFANVLQEVGIPADRVLASLLGFNVGVELGQIAIVLLLWLVLLILVRLFVGMRTSTKSAVLPADLLSAGLCSLGVYWFLQRAYF